jgi:hypothetical protein
VKLSVTDFINEQLELWPEVGSRFSSLTDVCVRTLPVNGVPVQVQFNPDRIISATAGVDTASVNSRPCFLCGSNRPGEQICYPWREYQILINPYPILPLHLTIVADIHIPQRIKGRLADMFSLARFLKNFLILYNGAQYGASAPDHFHFQAVEAGHTPLEMINNWDIRTPLAGKDTVIREESGFSGYHAVLSGNNPDKLCAAFNRIYDMLEEKNKGEEPGMNLFCRYVNNLWQLCIIPRRKHRPDCYFKTGDSQLIISPGAIDMAGVMITVRKKDFDRVTSSDMEQIYDEVAFVHSTPIHQ